MLSMIVQLVGFACAVDLNMNFNTHHHKEGKTTSGDVFIQDNLLLIWYK